MDVAACRPCSLCAAVRFATVTPARRQQAIDAFDKAQKIRATLEAQPEGKRRKEDFKQVIDAYYEVYRLNPAYSKTPVALAAIAELYREMGREYSIRLLLPGIDQGLPIPHGAVSAKPHSREALFTVGEVYRQDLEDPDEARKAFQEFLAMYPKSDKAGEAKDFLEQDGPAIRGKSKAAPLPAAAGSNPAPPVAPPVVKVEEEKPSGVRQVTAVRRWVGPNYLRIVIEVDGEVKFESVRLSNPDRIVVDLQTARLSPELVGKTFPVENGFLRQIRVAQFSPDVARVVLDVQKIEAYSIFSLPNPFRLVIDVQGAAPPQMAKAGHPTAPTATAESRKAEKDSSARHRSAPAPAEVETAAKTPPRRLRPRLKTKPEPSTPPAEGRDAAVAPPATDKQTRRSPRTRPKRSPAEAYACHSTRRPPPKRVPAP